MHLTFIRVDFLIFFSFSFLLVTPFSFSLFIPICIVFNFFFFFSLFILARTKGSGCSESVLFFSFLFWRVRIVVTQRMDY